MRTLVFFSIALQLFLGIDCSFGQVTKFYRLYSGNTDLRLFAVHQSQDNGFVAAGNATSTIGGNYFIVKVDSIGNEMWRSVGGFFNTLDSDNVTNSVIQTIDGGYIACGSITQFHPGIGTDYQNFLIKLDSTGQLLWQKAIGIDTCYESLWDLTSLSTGEFICVGLQYTNQSNLSVLKFDSSGAKIWQVNYPMGNYFADKSIISKCFNSDLLILTTLSSNGSVLTRIDTSGVILNQQFIFDTLVSSPVTLKEFAPFRYKFIRQSNSSPFDALISEMDSNFNILNTYYTGSINSAAIIDSSQMYCCATEICCWKSDLFGDTIWKSSIIDPRLIPNHIIVTSDGCALNCGFINHDATAFGVGFLWSVCDSSLLANTSEIFVDKIHIYPVPTTGLININMPEEFISKFKNISLMISDSMGKMIFQTRINKPQMQLSLETLKSGVYTFNFISNNQRIYSDRVVLK